MSIRWPSGFGKVAESKDFFYTGAVCTFAPSVALVRGFLFLPAVGENSIWGHWTIEKLLEFIRARVDQAHGVKFIVLWSYEYGRVVGAFEEVCQSKSRRQ